MTARPPRRSRQALAAVLIPLAAFAACGPSLHHKTIEMQPIGTVPAADRTPKRDDGDGGVTSPNSGSATPSAAGRDGCTGAEIEPLDETLKQCEVAMPKSADLQGGMKEKLEVRVTPSTGQIAPGGRIDLVVVLRNKSNDALPLYFSGDPAPRFEVEAYDARGKRVDIPPGRQPPWPKGTTPPTREVKASRVTLEKGGLARVKVPWDAVRMKWAPEKAKTWEGRGFPRVPNGGLPGGKYNLRVVVPILNDVDIPKIAIEVGG